MGEYHDQAARLASAIRLGIERLHERHGLGRRRGTVLSTSPLRVDLHGEDMELDGQDVTLGRSVASEGVSEGDVLVLVEVDEGEWVAVDVEDSGE